MGNDSAPELVEEVRVAMALNGGVSLAVWMGGCAVEFDTARRAHLPKEEPTVYATLCRAFARELVVDVMSGASAGGINGAMLGAAMVHGRRLEAEFVRERWVTLGDFSALLQPTRNADPRALMQGELFAERLEETFREIIEPTEQEGAPADPRPRPPKVRDVKLDITTTDLVGEPVRFRDFWGQPLDAREHRARFRFRRPGHFDPVRLARAARSSASFPLAFEPYQLNGKDTPLTRLKGRRWVVDGGLLDNAPIAAAIDLIPGRIANRQVRRFVCYLIADPPPGQNENEGIADDDEPLMAAIVGHLISLPRKAPFVDQLRAIERATRQSLIADSKPDLQLLELPILALEATATKLRPAYVTQRTLGSLDELLGNPGMATRIVRSQPGLELPWIPASLHWSGSSGRWQWGTRVAERAAHLLLDAIRRAVPHAGVKDRPRLFAAREEICHHVASFECNRDRVLAAADDEPDSPLLAAMAEAQFFDPMPRLERAAAALQRVEDLLRPGEMTALFGPPDDPGRDPEPFKNFLRRALAIEVIRRAEYAGPEIESGQELRFVQLTPQARGLLFDPKPWSATAPAVPRDKLLGIRLGHFGGFYRASWRANDFLWGRMDAATRIVDMLVSPGRVKQIECDDWRESKAWDVLADGLVPAKPDFKQLDDYDQARAGLIAEALADLPLGYPTEGDTLRDRLAKALHYDLVGVSDKDARGRLTRIVCTRAAQLAIFHAEWPAVVAASNADHKGGGGTPALEGLSTKNAVEELRKGPSLLERLVAPDEVTSDLALRTGAHAGLVTLGALRAAKLPLARGLLGMRAMILPVAASVARSWLSRAALGLAFTAAAWLLAVRVLATTVPAGEDATTTVTITGAWASYLVVAAIALLIVAGTVAVPAVRFWKGKHIPRRLIEAGRTVLLAATGIGAAVVAAVWKGGLTLPDLLAAPGACPVADGCPLPTWVANVAIGVAVGLPIAIVPALLTGWVDKLTAKPYGGLAMLAAFVLVSALVILTTVGDLWEQARDADATWEQVTAWIALAAPVISALCLVPLRQFNRKARNTAPDVVQKRSRLPGVSTQLR